MTVCRFMCTAGAALAIVSAAACGDPGTYDDRGYTKAPLEDPSVIVDGEEPGEMSRYGSPNRVVAEELELPEEVAAAPEEEEQAAPVDLPEGVTQEMVAAGEQVFGGAGLCMACHGANATGGPLAPDLTDAEWLHIEGSYEEIVETITTGVPSPIQFPAAMPARGGSAITDEQVREVAAYVYSISR